MSRCSRRRIGGSAYWRTASIGRRARAPPPRFNRLLRLTLLAPDIQEATPDRQPKELVLEEMRRAMPNAREEQHRLMFERFAKSKPRPFTDDRDMGGITVGFPNILRLALMISLTEGSRSKTMDACG